MSRQIVMVLVTFFLGISLPVYGQVGSSSGNYSYIGQTQERRSSERFNIIDFIRSNQAAVAAQNAKYGYGRGGTGGPFPDLTLTYMQDLGPVTRNGITLGKDTRGMGRIQFYLDDLFTKGSRTKSLNIDLGVEGFLGQTLAFVADPGVTQLSHTYTEMGGGLLIRPFGRSSQDTGLSVKGGYMTLNETGLWANNQTQVSLYGPYLGAEAKLYLLNFLGGFAEYQTVLETDANALQAHWKMQRFRYGGFLEIYLVNLSAYLMSTEMIISDKTSGNTTKENYAGAGFAATMYF